MLALLAFTTAIFVGREVPAPPPKATTPVVANVAATAAIGNDFLVAYAVNQSVDVQPITGATGKPAHDRATILGTYASAPVSVAIASNGTNAMVAWCLSSYEVYVALIGRDGHPLVVRRIDHHNALHVALESLGDRYLLVLQASDAAGMLLDATTSQPIGGEVFYYPRTSEVTAASNGDTAFVAFIGDRIVTFLVTHDVAQRGPSFTDVASNLHSAWDGSEFVVAWNRRQQLIVATVAADASIVRNAAELTQTNEPIAAVIGMDVVLSNRTIVAGGAIVPLPIDGVGSVIDVAPNGATNLAILASPQLSAALTNLVDATTAVPVAFTSSQSSPAIAAGLTQFFVGWTETDRDVVARFANDSFASDASLPLGQINVAAVDDGATAVTLDATTLTAHSIAPDGSLLRSTRLGERNFSDMSLTGLRRNGDLFGALLTPVQEFLVFSDRAWITDLPLPTFFVGDLTTIGDHWLAVYCELSGGCRLDEIDYLGRTLATRKSRELPPFPGWMAVAADDRGDLFVALPDSDSIQLWFVDVRGKARPQATVYYSTRAHVAWSGKEFVVVTEGNGLGRLEARLFDRDGNMTANVVGIPTPLPPRDLSLAAGPAGIAIAYVRGEATLGDGDHVFVRQLAPYLVHARPVR